MTLCSVGPPSPAASNHPRKSRSSRAYGAFYSSSRSAISCATELLPEPYTPVMSTAPSTPLFTPASYLLLPAVAIGVGEPLGVVWGRSPPSSGILRYSLKCVEVEFSAPLCQAALREGACESATRLLKTASEMRLLRHRRASLRDLPSAIFLR